MEALLLRGRTFTDLLQSDRALLDFEAVLSKNPNHFEAMEGRASALASLGQVEEAKRQYFCLLELKPTHVLALQVLSGLPDLSEQELEKLDECLSLAEQELPKNKDGQTHKLGFARYELAMRQGDNVQAMRHLAEAKARAARLNPFDDAVAETKCRSILAMADLPRASDPDYAMPRPIFVVGLPRSGTTLLEMIISAHSAIQGCGELSAVLDWTKRNPKARLC